MFKCYQSTSNWCLSLSNQSWQAPNDLSECASECRSTLWKCRTSLVLNVLLWSSLYLDFLGVSHRILWKNENAVYRLQKYALVPEIFKFEKWVKYANEMTDDVIHSTQYYIKCINNPIQRFPTWHFASMLFCSCFISRILVWTISDILFSSRWWKLWPNYIIDSKSAYFSGRQRCEMFRDI